MLFSKQTFSFNSKIYKLGNLTKNLNVQSCLKSATKLIGLAVITSTLIKKYSCRKTAFYQSSAIVIAKSLFQHTNSSIHTHV